MFHSSSVSGRRLSSYPVELLCRELEARGTDPGPVLARHGVERASFHALTGRLPASTMLALAADLIALSGDPLLALRCGTRVDLADYGLFGLLVRASTDFPTAAGHYLRYNDGRDGDRAFNLDATLSPEGVLLRYRGTGEDEVPAFLHHAFASVVVAVTRMMFSVDPAWVELAIPEPADGAEYQRVLGAPVRFGRPVTRLLVPVATLLPGFPTGADGAPGQAGPCTPGATWEDRSERSALVRRVQSLLLARPGSPPPTMTQVAERLSTTERTLRRHLNAAGTTFHDLLDQSRHRAAVETITLHPEVTGAELAVRLGYTDPPAFYRAFKRWTGMSLTQYRRMAHGAATGPSRTAAAEALGTAAQA